MTIRRSFFRKVSTIDQAEKLTRAVEDEGGELVSFCHCAMDPKEEQQFYVAVYRDDGKPRWSARLEMLEVYNETSTV